METLFKLFAMMTVVFHKLSVCADREYENLVCEQVCDKYRTSKEAFIVNCKDHQNDTDCLNEEPCRSCPEICTDDKDYPNLKVYSCRFENAFHNSTIASALEQPSNSENDRIEDSLAYRIIAMISGISFVIGFCIFMSWLCYTRARDRDGRCHEWYAY